MERFAILDNLQLEQKILAACVYPQATSDPRLNAQLVSGVNWDRLLFLAARHGLKPLLFRALDSAASGSVPPQVLEDLRRFYRQNTRRNLYLAYKLSALVEQFRQRDIPVIVFKGPALASQAYGDLALRQFQDLDILIHPQDFSSAYHLLLQMGWQSERPVSQGQKAALLQEEADFPELPFKDSANALLELHWAVSLQREIYPLPQDFLWQNPGQVALPGGPAATFSPERALWVSCIHGARHEWANWKWIADLAFLCAAHPNIHWAVELDRYAGFGFKNVVCLGLALVEALTGQPAAPELKGLKYSPSIEKIVRQTLFQEPQPDKGWGSLHNSLYFARLRERRREQVFFWLDRVLRPNQLDRQAFRLPRPLLYFTRPLRLWGKAIRMVLERFILV